MGADKAPKQGEKDTPTVGEDLLTTEQRFEASDACAHLALSKILNLANLRANVSAGDVIDAITSSKVDIGRVQEGTAGL